MIWPTTETKCACADEWQRLAKAPAQSATDVLGSSATCASRVECQRSTPGMRRSSTPTPSPFGRCQERSGGCCEATEFIRKALLDNGCAEHRHRARDQEKEEAEVPRPESVHIGAIA